MSKAGILQKMVGVAAAATALVVAAGPAGAAVGVTPSNPVPVSGGQLSTPITVSWSGLPTSPSSPDGRRVFITQCKKSPADPTFQFAFDCSNSSEVTLNPGQNVTGSGSTSFTAFHGTEPSGDNNWGCFGSGETPPAGITAVTTCYIRVTEDAETNSGDQQFTPLTFSVTSAVTPETSHAALLPVVAVAIVGGGALPLARRRRRRAA